MGGLAVFCINEGTVLKTYEDAAAVMNDVICWMRGLEPMRVNGGRYHPRPFLKRLTVIFDPDRIRGEVALLLKLVGRIRRHYSQYCHAMCMHVYAGSFHKIRVILSIFAVFHNIVIDQH